MDLLIRRPKAGPVALAALLGACALAPTPAFAVDLRADTDRNGTVDLTGTTDEDLEAAGASAIFLANVDDDSGRCPTRDRRGRPLSDLALARCNDASDAEVDGPADLLDLARVRLLADPAAAPGSTGTVTVRAAGQAPVRLFVRRAGRLVAFDGRLTASEVRRGAELAVEGTDVVRDPRRWDGSLELHAQADGASDDVRLQMAPLLTQPDTAPASRILTPPALGSDPDGRRFIRELDRARRRAGIRAPLVTAGVTDPYIQDAFEPTTASMPAPGGGQHVMRVLLRSANVDDPRGPKLREGGRIVFTRLRGRDVGAVQQVDLGWARRHPREQTFNSTGNLQTIPPHPGFPLGRMLVGDVPGHGPDPSFLRLLDAQRLQRPLHIDTSWLEVGHVDEVVSFVPSSAPRGWSMLVADPRLGLDLLRAASAAGHGDRKLLEGKRQDDDEVTRTPAGLLVERVSATRTVDQVLADRDVVRSTLRAARRIDEQVAAIRQAVGLTEDEPVRLASLFSLSTFLEPGERKATRGPGLVHYLPAIVNGQPLGQGVYAAPDPLGPVVDGEDVFKRQARQALAAVGVQVSWVDTWSFHQGYGDLHCATNILREVSAPWWLSAGAPTNGA